MVKKLILKETACEGGFFCFYEKIVQNVKNNVFFAFFLKISLKKLASFK